MSRVAVGFFLILLSIKAPAAELAVDPYVCPIETKEILSRWKVGVDSDWVKQPANDFEHSYKTHASKLGEWVTISTPNEHATQVEHFLGNGKREKVTLTEKKCSDQQWVVQEPRDTKSEEKYSSVEFTDADLEKILNKNKNGVIYIWSPNMSLSQRGVHEIQKAAKKVNLPVTYMMDPVADETFAKEFIKEQKLPEPAMKRVNSRELAGYGATIHYPALIVYRNGKICKTVQRGYRDQEAYRKIIDGIYGDCK